MAKASTSAVATKYAPSAVIPGVVAMAAKTSPAPIPMQQVMQETTGRESEPDNDFDDNNNNVD